jgi:hypothetical protein
MNTLPTVRAALLAELERGLMKSAFPVSHPIGPS